jgi:hypothetical protein
VETGDWACRKGCDRVLTTAAGRNGHESRAHISAERLEALFVARLDKSGECWVWTGPLKPDGYGRLTRNHRAVYAHRYAYELWVGPIPSGLELDHLCLTKACVRPDHLEPVTKLENMQRSWKLRARTTHCPRGHEYDRFYPSGQKRCSTCQAERRAA